MSQTAKCWHFTQRPTGNVNADTFTLQDDPLPPLESGQILVRPVYVSMDPTNRVWLSDWENKYMDPVPLGAPMLGFTLGRIEASRHPEYPEGHLVTGLGPWAERYVLTPDQAWTLFPEMPADQLAEAFGILAIAGPTAIVGLLEIGQPEAGDTVLISAAAGAVGSVAGQIAKIHGCRVIGIAGGEEKCRSLIEDFGFDAAVDYKQGNLLADLKAQAPEGIDVLFENVGGDILDAGLSFMNNGGRVVICGLISSYSKPGSEPVPGPYNFAELIFKRLRMEGFVILDHLDRYPQFHEQLVGWMDAGRINFRLHTIQGIESAPEALAMLFTGSNTGKLMVQFSGP